MMLATPFLGRAPVSVRPPRISPKSNGFGDVVPGKKQSWNYYDFYTLRIVLEIVQDEFRFPLDKGEYEK
jgi:hypothetical protein